MNISKIKGIGEKTLEVLNKKGIYDHLDIIKYIPRKYTCYNVCNDDLFSEDKVSVLGIIDSNIAVKKIKYNECLIFTTSINNYKIKTLCFGKSYLRYKLKKGTKVILYGVYKSDIKTFVATDIFLELFSIKIDVSYKLDGLSDTQFQKFVSIALSYGDKLNELPIKYCKKYRLYDDEAYFYYSHFPRSKEILYQVERRRKYEEFFWYAFSLEALKVKKKNTVKKLKDIKEEYLVDALNEIKYELTDDQKNSVMDIFNDLKSDKVMNRLIQGDVGCGKTIVSFIAMYLVIRAGYKVMMMAPTEALANQHYNNAINTFKNINTKLITSSVKKSERKKIFDSDVDFLIGTHALLFDDIVLDNLGLVIIDEQHKFGVKQRAKLLSKQKDVDSLYLTATPIPRTLGLSEFGDLDISSIHNLPHKKKDIKTYVYPMKELYKVFDVIKKELDNNYQAYVVVPFIEESSIGGIDIHEAYDIFSKEFFGKRIGILHGKLKNIEKENILNDFKIGEIDILISTTVIEVGIDVYNATTMVILNANRFGLSQLHQLRGRIGRNNYENHCFLISDSKDCVRLNILKECSDGFLLANEDFKLRGPGDFLGEEQSGFLNFEFSNILEDYKIWDCAKMDAKEYYNDYINNKVNDEKVEKIINKILYENTLIH